VAVQVMLAVALAVASPGSEAPAAIPSAQLVRAAEGAYAELRRIAELAGPTGAPDDLAGHLAGVERELDQLRSAGSAARTTPFNADADYVRREVARRQLIVRRWDDQLSTRAQLLDAATGTLTRLIETWRLTAASLDAETPPALVARAGDVRDRASAMESAVRQRLAAVLALQDRVAAVKLALSVLLADLEDAEAAKRQELFEIESTPLWRGAAWTRSPHAPGPLRVLQMHGRAVAAYVASEPARSLVHLVLAAALIAAGLSVTRRLLSASPAIAKSSVGILVVTRYPVESALLLALLVAPLFHPGRPPALDLLLYLAGLVPVVRIAGVLAPSWRRPVRWVAALFVIERLIAFAPEIGAPVRVALLVIPLAGVVGCVAGLRKGGWLRRIESGRWKVLLVAGAAMAAALFAISTVANLVGNVTLAEFLTSSTLASVFGAAVIAAGAAAASGALRALLELRSSNRFRIVRDHKQLLVHRVGKLLRIASVLLWVYFMLTVFQATQSFRDGAAGVLGLRIKVGGLDLSLGDVVAFAVTLWVAVWISRALKFVLDRAVLPSLDLGRGSALAISTTAQYVIVGIGFGAAVLAAGVEVTRFTVFIGTLGVGIGFGLQNVVNNFVSGLILLYEQPVQVGDVIELGTLTGEIRRIGVRSSTVRTFQGADVIVPNSNFISAEVVNWTGTDRWRRVDIGLGVSYGTEPGRVIELLLGIAKGNGAVAATPEPVAFFTGFGESALQFELRVWTAVDAWVATASALRTSIHDVLPREGIVLAFPQLDLWVRSVPPASKKTTQAIPGIARVPSPEAEPGPAATAPAETVYPLGGWRSSREPKK
jgi:potassium-dependent mechanosensitive channel